MQVSGPGEAVRKSRKEVRSMRPITTPFTGFPRELLAGKISHYVGGGLAPSHAPPLPSLAEATSSLSHRHAASEKRHLFALGLHSDI